MEMIAYTKNGTYGASLHGAFTFTDNGVFRTILEKLGEPDIHNVVLDMGEVDFIDSAALGMLLLAHDAAKHYQKRIILEGVKGKVKRIFEMARFEHFFPLS